MAQPHSRLSIEQIAVARLAIQHMQARRSARYGRWDEAFRQLDDGDQTTLGRNKATRVDIKRLIRKVEEKKEECDGKKWTLFKRSDGTHVKVRDVLEKIAQWMKKFEKVGDMVTSFDPVHASLPWAGVKILLEASTSDFDAYATITDGLEVVSRVIVQVAEVEKYSPHAGFIGLKTEMSRNVVEIYVKVLKFLAIAQRFFNENAGIRWMKGMFQRLQKAVKELVDGISVEIGHVHMLFNRANWQANNANSADRHREIIDHLRDLEDLVRTLTAPKHTVQQQRAQIRRWLDPIVSDGAQKEILDLRHGTTCDWIFSNPEFERWSQYDSKLSKILWIHALPGHGKSVLCARLIDHMQKDKVHHDGVNFFYCSGEDITRRYPIAILRSWIWQLVAKSDDAVMSVVDEEQALCGINDGNVASEADQDCLWNLLAKLMAMKTKDVGYTLVVDGYDECLDTPTSLSKYNTSPYRVHFLQKLTETIRGAGIRVLLLSRYQTEIDDVFKDCSTDPSTLEIIKYCVTRDDTRRDLSSYSQTIFESKIGQSQVLTTMAADAVTKSDGMFLWLALLNKSLLEGATLGEAQDLVDETPAEIFKAYQAELDRILDPKSKMIKRAVTILKWILYAARPLTVREMTEILAVSLHKDPKTYPRDYLPRDFAKGTVDDKYVQNYIRMPCGSLIELRQASEGTPTSERTIHFVHFTVKEFLQQSPCLERISDSNLCFLNEDIEHSRIACLCLKYMCYDVFNSASKEGTANLASFSKMFPFSLYTASNWAEHYARGGSITTQIETDQILWRFFSTTSWKVWAEMYEQHLHDTSRDRTGGFRSRAKGEYSDSGYVSLERDELPSDSEEDSVVSDSPSGSSSGKAEHIAWRTSPSPVYYAAILGLSDMIHRLVKLAPRNCMLEGGKFGNPLQAAVVNEQSHAVKALLEHEASPSQQGGVYGTPLIASVILGSSDIFGQLLGVCTKLDTTDNNGMTALFHACSFGQFNMVAKLVAAGADMTIKSDWGISPFIRAVEQNHIEIVDFLLRNGADVNRKEGRGDQTGLIFAIVAQHEDMAKLLLKHHANPILPNKYGATALHMACWRGLVELAKLLIEKYKGEVEVTDSYGWTPLHYAADSGSKEVAELLLEHGAFPFKAAPTSGLTAVDMAIAHGTKALLEVFITTKLLAATDTAMLLHTLAFASSVEDLGPFIIVSRTILERTLSVESIRDILTLALKRDQLSLLDVFKEHIQNHVVPHMNPMALDATLWSEEEQELIRKISWGTKTQKDFVLDPVWGSYLAAKEIIPDMMLPIAVSNRASSVVSMLLQRGADMHHQVQIGAPTLQSSLSPLEIAINQESRELLSLMLKEGRVSRTGEKGIHLLNSLESTCSRGGIRLADVTRMMIAHGALDADSDRTTLDDFNALKTNELTGVRDKDSNSGSDDFHPDADAQGSNDDAMTNRDVDWWSHVLVGQWQGNYTYIGIRPTHAPSSDSMSFRIHSASKSSSMLTKDVVFFDGQGEDAIDSFAVHGQVRSTTSIRFVKLYPKHGWVYEGHIYKAKTGWHIQGNWGARFGQARGSFTMSKDATA